MLGKIFQRGTEPKTPVAAAPANEGQCNRGKVVSLSQRRSCRLEPARYGVVDPHGVCRQSGWDSAAVRMIAEAAAALPVVLQDSRASGLRTHPVLKLVDACQTVRRGRRSCLKRFVRPNCCSPAMAMWKQLAATAVAPLQSCMYCARIG